DRIEGDAHLDGFFTIDIQVNLRDSGAEISIQSSDDRIRIPTIHQIGHRHLQNIHSGRTPIQNLNLEATSIPQSLNGWRNKRKGNRFLNLRQFDMQLFDQSKYMQV